MPKLYVGIVLHGFSSTLAEGLQSILDSELDFSTKFVIVENGSPNPEELRPVLDAIKADPRVIVISTGKNLGCAGGWNTCIREAANDPEYEYVVLVGPDVFVHPKSINNLVLRYLEGDVDITSGVDCNWEDPMPELSQQEVPGANFVFILLPKRVIDIVGLFDEGFYPAYHEDNDLHSRAKLAGCGRGIWTWMAPCRHVRSSTIRKYPQLAARFPETAAYFYKKWGVTVADLNKIEGIRQADEKWAYEFNILQEKRKKNGKV